MCGRLAPALPSPKGRRGSPGRGAGPWSPVSEGWQAAWVVPVVWPQGGAGGGSGAAAGEGHGQPLPFGKAGVQGRGRRTEVEFKIRQK